MELSPQAVITYLLGGKLDNGVEISAKYIGNRRPLDVFLHQKPSYDHKVKYMGVNIAVPSFKHEGYVIWGLTGYMIVEFMRQVYDADIEWRWPNPLKR